MLTSRCFLASVTPSRHAEPTDHTAPTSQECFLRQMKHTDSYLSHCFLSLSPFLLIYLSFSHSDAKVTALCFPLPSLSIAVAAVADSCVTQAPEKPESPTRKVEAPDPSLSPADPCPPGSSILLPACNGGLQVTYLSTPLWALKVANVPRFIC